MAKLIVSLLESHPGGDGFVRNAEGSPETAAVVRPVYRYKHQALHLRKQICCLIEGNTHDLGRLRDTESANRATTIVNRYRVLKFSPGEGIDLQDIVEEFD